jgi:hypothetical protein
MSKGAPGDLDAPSWRERSERSERAGSDPGDPDDLAQGERSERSDRSGPNCMKDGKVYESEDSLDSFLFFVLNLVIVSSIQNLTAINHESLDTSLHTSDTTAATSLPTST